MTFSAVQATTRPSTSPALSLTAPVDGQTRSGGTTVSLLGAVPQSATAITSLCPALPMARIPVPPLLTKLRSAKTLADQNAALQTLKTEVIGHAQKKALWISLGVLEPIVAILSASNPYSKLNGKDAHPCPGSRPVSEEDGVKIQSLQLITSFANGTLLPCLQAAVGVFEAKPLIPSGRWHILSSPAALSACAARHLGQHISHRQCAANRRRRTAGLNSHIWCRRAGLSKVGPWP